jgi:hypothetical protein
VIGDSRGIILIYYLLIRIIILFELGYRMT